MYALSLRRAPLVLARWGTLTARSGLRSSPGHLAAPSSSISSLPRSLPQATLARLRSIHCYTFAWKNVEEGTSQPPREPVEEGTSQPPREPVIPIYEEKKYPPPLFVTLLVGVASAFIGAYLQSSLGAKAGVELEEMKKSTRLDITRLSYILERAKLPEHDNPDFVPVPAVKRINTLVRKSKLFPTNTTVLIHGPRGVGKTTVMKHALKDVEGIIHIQPNPFTVEKFYECILEVLNIKTHEHSNAALVINALKKIESRNGNKPTIVVDVNEKVDEKELMAILIELKIIGADSNLSSTFVVLSTCRAALLLPLALHELRVSVRCINDPPTMAIVNYLNKRLSELFPESKPKEREGWIMYYTKEIGNRFLDASNLVSELRLQEPKAINVKDYIEEFVKRRKKTYSLATSELIEMIDENKAASRELKREVFSGIINGTLPLSKLVVATGKDNWKEFLKIVADIHPHPVYIDPETLWVGVGNFVAREKFEKQL